MRVECSYKKLVPIEELKPHKNNRNVHPEKQIKALAKIIAKNGMRSPIVVSNLSGFVVKGHGRLEALKFLGWGEVPVDYQDYADESEELRDRIADNEIARYGEFDKEGFLADIEGLEDLDFEEFGLIDFELPEIEQVPQCDEDDCPEPPKEPKTVIGDIYELGNHRVMCGDSTMIDDVEKLMSGEKADMVFTDPPYNQSTTGGGFLNKVRESRRKLIQSDNLNSFDPEEFLNILEIIKPQTSYIFCSKNLIKKYLERIEDKNWNLLVMRKRNPIPQKNNTFLADIEYLFCIREKGAYWKNDCPYNYYRRVRDITVKQSEFGHPTEKQVDFIEPYFELSSKPNYLILDLFLGSGTTLITSHKNNRRCYGMELDPVYVDVCVSRYVKYTGNNKIKLNGQEIEWSVE